MGDVRSVRGIWPTVWGSVELGAGPGVADGTTVEGNMEETLWDVGIVMSAPFMAGLIIDVHGSITHAAVPA